MADNEEFNMQNIEQASTVDVTDKKCPNCGATVTYNPETLTMACDFCGYTRELPKPDMGATVQEIDFASATIRSSKNWGSKMKSINCKNCGGETIYDDAETAACCPFCGSTNVMPVDNDEDVMAPGGVVPFEISQDKAAALFQTWIKKKWFVPNAAKKSCAAKNFNGLYLPYWTYDTLTTSPYSARIGFEYKVKRGDGYETKVNWRNCSGIYQEFIDDQVVYASTKTTDPNIKKVSDFNFSKLRAYDPQFVAGFGAERYTLGLDDGWEEAKKLIMNRLRSGIRSDIQKRYRPDRIENINFSTAYDKVTFKYVLAPIWLANYKFNGKVFNLAVNGQTGKISGEAPVSPWKVAIFVAILIAIFILIAVLLNNS